MPSIKTDDYARLYNNGKDWILARDLCFQCNVFFDFETTSDSNSQHFTGSLLKKFYSEARDQITCAVSYMYRVKAQIAKYASILEKVVED
jgi:hypothetical protein